MRYPITKATRAALSIAVILYAALHFPHGNSSVGAASSALPPLTGEAAVARLKEQGLYSSLIEAAREARGDARSLPARFEPAAGVEDRQTASPAEPAQAINTPFMQLYRQTARDGGEIDSYGWSVAAGADTVVVGAYKDTVGNNPGQGSAYVFTMSGGDWTLQQKLTANDGEAGELFGHSVAISGDKIVVGAPYDKSGTNLYQGAAYVFTRSGGVWSFQQKLTAPDREARDQFGYSVAISGNTVIAGAITDDVGTKADQGSAYVFVRSGGVWSFQQKLTANDGEADDRFGAAVAISGDTIVAGAPLGDWETSQDVGSAYFFVRSGTVWAQQQRLIGPISIRIGASKNEFGAAVAISGDIALIGAPGFSPFGRTEQGLALSFRRSGGAWRSFGSMEIDDGEPGDRFGHSVTLNGDTALIGAAFDDVGPNLDQGSAYLFTRSSEKWERRQKFTALGGRVRELFGHTVALSGGRAIAGAPFARIGENAFQGAVYIFGCGYAEQQRVFGFDSEFNDDFGSAVAIDGDTAVIGAPGDDVGPDSDRGSAYVFTRSGAEWTQSAQLFAPGRGDNILFGRSVAISGNTIVVGAPGVSNNNRSQGAAYVFVGAGATWAPQATLFGGAPDDYFGNSVSISGDLLAVGAQFDDVGANGNQGSVTLFKRSGANWSLEQMVTASDGVADEYFGKSVALSGDRVIVGAPGPASGERSKGAAYVFERSSTQSPIWVQRAKLVANDGRNFEHFGDSVALSGNTALISAQGYAYNDPPRPQAAYVFVTSSAKEGRWTQQAKLIIGEDDFFNPLPVALSGDIAVIGMPLDSIDDRIAQGTARVFRRSGAVWSLQHQIVAGGAESRDEFSYSVAVSGDTIMVGAPFAGRGEEGLVYVLKTNCAAPLAPFASVSAASYDASVGLAPESIVAGFGSNLATGVEAASSLPLPTTLAGVSVKIKDSDDVDRLAPLFFASSGQINYQIPPGTAYGPCSITVIGAASDIASGVVQITGVAPGLFSANSSGAGVANAFALRIKADGSQTYEHVAQFDPTQNRMVPVPLDLGPANDQVFLVLFGAGLRQRSSLSAVSCAIGGVNSEVLYAGPAQAFAGLDQVNVRLPRSLAGRGEVDVSLSVDGKAANTVRVSIR